MNKLLVPILVMLLSVPNAVHSQTEKPERIVTFVKTEHDSKWYAHQADLWEKEVKRNPENDDAWIFWFAATRYKLMFQASEKGDANTEFDETPLKDIAYILHGKRPNSFARYYIDNECRQKLHDCDGLEDHMLEAIRMRPDFEELYPMYVIYLWQTGHEDMMADILKRWYNTGEYSYVILSYAFNSLAGMEKNGIFLTYGDVPTYSSLLVQYGKDMFKDILIINKTLLIIPEYMKSICGKLGISPIEGPADRSDEGMQKWEADLITTISEKTGRPLYISSPDNHPVLSDQMYSEGLVIRYSPKKYDNLAVKRRNFESVYHTDYLYETFVPETYDASAYKLNLNYIPSFKSLLKFYKAEGMKKEYDELHGLMTNILSKCKGLVDAETLKYYYDEIER